jgi:magnesium-transporting ATPase (P-type)
LHGCPRRTCSTSCTARRGGLGQGDVTQRRLEYGSNTLTTERTTALRVLGRQFQSALIYFLVVAAILAFATRDLSDGVIITVILLINAGLGFSQEYRSERAVEKLSHLISAKIRVTRDAKSTLLDVADLVPGDVVTLEEGDVVPADIKLLTVEGLQVDESQLTGESVPVPKSVQADTSDEFATLWGATQGGKTGGGFGRTTPQLGPAPAGSYRPRVRGFLPRRMPSTSTAAATVRT